MQYLNNILEQDHRAIKRRVNSKQGFREFQAARRTIQGYEAMTMMRKRQVRWLSGTDVRRQVQFICNTTLDLPEAHRKRQDQFRRQFGPDYQAGDLIFANPDGSPLRYRLVLSYRG